MKVFQELQIVGEPEALRHAVEALTYSLNGHWHRDEQTESQYGSTAGQRTYFFVRDGTNELPAARLALHQKSPNELYVSNVVPIGNSRLGYDEYNGIVKEFFSKFVQPVEQQSNVSATLSDEHQDVRDWISSDTANLLHQFSAHANRSAAASHPSDKERWLRFIVSTHREGSQLDSEILRRWLEEEEGWPEEEATDLAREYERAREVLAFADP